MLHSGNDGTRRPGKDAWVTTFAAWMAHIRRSGKLTTASPSSLMSPIQSVAQEPILKLGRVRRYGRQSDANPHFLNRTDRTLSMRLLCIPKTLFELMT